MDPWGMGKGGYAMQKGYGSNKGYYKGHQKGWYPQGPQWRYYNNHNNYQQWSNPTGSPQRSQQPTKFKPLNSGLSQWACTHCGAVHNNMTKVKCRFAVTTGCPGGNPYATQLRPKENEGGPNLHPASAWQHPIISSLLQSSSSLSSSPSPDLSSSISQGLSKDF
eukprot:1329050-Karenia_brevis.AAC.1